MIQAGHFTVARRLAALMVVAVVGAACSTPGSGNATPTSAPATAAATASTVASMPAASPTIQTSGFDSLGPVTLNVWADSGEKDTFAKLIPLFNQKYPNVTVNVTFKDFNDYQATILNAMSSDNAPDVAQGNQSYADDGSLVANNLIIPLDAYAKVYGWDTRFASTLSQFQWVSGNKMFGSGPLWGLAPDDQSVGLFYDQAKLTKLGVSKPASLDDFESILAKAKAAGEVGIQLGAADKQGPLRVWGLVQAAFVPTQQIRDWITGKAGSTIDNDANIAAAQKLVDWVKAGYFANGFNGVSEDDSVSKFVNGQGVFLFDGNWYVSTVEKGLGTNAGYMNFPVGPSGSFGASGSSGLGWHISSKSKHPDLAAAFIAEILSQEFMPDLVSVGRIPAQPGAQISGGLLAQAAKASEDLLAANGETWYPDWATATMYDTLTAALQELLGGKLTPKDFVTKLQTDWNGTWGK